MEKPKVLAIDDEMDVLTMYKTLLKKSYNIFTAENGEKGLAILKEHTIDLILLDLKMPGMDGLETLKRIKEIDDKATVIIVSALSDIKSAVNSIKKGATDFVNKPFELEELTSVMENALNRKKLEMENLYLKTALSEKTSYGSLIGKSLAMKRIFELVDTVAKSSSSIIITGESGTGKELVAQAIHQKSLRCQYPFVAINCAAIPDNLFESELFGHERGAFTGAFERRIGKFEMAHMGTLFLDEIGCMPTNLQSKLLRAIQENKIERIGGTKPIEVDVRIVSATNQDLTQAIQDKNFREDLFYRLNVIPVHLPPLRERKEDIPLLIFHFLKRFNEELKKNIKGISKEAEQVLLNYNWPGNVRELSNVIERAVVLCQKNEIAAPDLFVLVQNTYPTTAAQNLDEAVNNFKREFLLQALKHNNNNHTQTAKNLGIHRSTLLSKLKNLGIK